MKAQGKCTTDHISAAGPWLKYRGHLENISGNLFLGVVNAFTGGTGEGKDVTDGETRSFPEIAKRYGEQGVRWCAVGDRNYGEGSSREHAAMEPRFRGGVVIFARSFARIHETNAKKQGLVPLTFADPATYDEIGEDDRINVLGLPPVPGQPVQCQIVKPDGATVDFETTHTFSPEQVEWFKAGSALNIVRGSKVADARRLMDVVSTLRTTGAVRSFTDEAVPDAAVHQLLDDARYAPSGGNRQPWRVAIVKDPVIRRRLGDLMQPVWDAYTARGALGVTPFNAVDDVEPDTVAHAPNPLLDGIESVPVVLAVAADLRRIALMDGELDRPPITGGASIYPFCWSILLAGHDRGLGGVMTTFLSRVEQDAASELGLPAHHALAATIFLGVPERRATKLRRDPVETFTTVDRFDGPAFTP